MDEVWQRAQEAELSDWESKSQGSEKERWKTFLDEHPSLVNHSKALEIGCGPDGIIFYIQGELKVGFDPLMKSYSELIQMRGDIFYIAGVGESLPFKEGFFTSIFCMNALDHTSSPAMVLSEIKRILGHEGRAFIHLYSYPKLDKLFLKLSKGFGYKDSADVYHPHKLSPQDVIDLVRTAGFKIETEEVKTFRPPIKPFLRTRKLLIHTILRTLDYFLFPLSKKQLGLSVYLELKK